MGIKNPSSGYNANFQCLLASKTNFQLSISNSKFPIILFNFLCKNRKSERPTSGINLFYIFTFHFIYSFHYRADTLPFYLDSVILKNQEKLAYEKKIAMVLIGYYFIALKKKPGLGNTKNPLQNFEVSKILL